MKIIDEIASLEDGWDGYKAKKFSKEHCDFVREILSMLPKKPEVFPTASDSIQLDYLKLENDDYLEFEIYSNKKICMYRVNEQGTILKEVNIDEMIEEIRRF